jgi:hypothetical protein
MCFNSMLPYMILCIFLRNQLVTAWLFSGGNWWRRCNSMLPCLYFQVFHMCFVTHAIHGLHLYGWCDSTSNPCTSHYINQILSMDSQVLLCMHNCQSHIGSRLSQNFITFHWNPNVEQIFLQHPFIF